VQIGQTELCRFTAGHETYTLKLATLHLAWPWERVMDMDGAIGWPDLKDDFIAIDATDDAIKGVDRVPQDDHGWTKLSLYRRTDVLALEFRAPMGDRRHGGGYGQCRRCQPFACALEGMARDASPCARGVGNQLHAWFGPGHRAAL